MSLEGGVESGREGMAEAKVAEGRGAGRGLRFLTKGWSPKGPQGMGLKCRSTGPSPEHGVTLDGQRLWQRVAPMGLASRQLGSPAPLLVSFTSLVTSVQMAPDTGCGAWSLGSGLYHLSVAPWVLVRRPSGSGL